ncbi:unnamed protein product, partial [Laminaria digitata]
YFQGASSFFSDLDFPVVLFLVSTKISVVVLVSYSNISSVGLACLFLVIRPQNCRAPFFRFQLVWLDSLTRFRRYSRPPTPRGSAFYCQPVWLAPFLKQAAINCRDIM